MPVKIKTQTPGPQPRISDSLGLGWNLRICISNKLPVGADTASLEPFSETNSYLLILPGGSATCDKHLGSRDGARTGQGHSLEPREGGTARGRMPMQMGTSAGSLTSSEATGFLCRVPVISIHRGEV